MNLIKELKRESSQWMKQQAADRADFYWQRGYATFSISPGHVTGLTEYITTQEQHHAGETYQDELRRLCDIYGVALDVAVCLGLTKCEYNAVGVAQHRACNTWGKSLPRLTPGWRMQRFQRKDLLEAAPASLPQRGYTPQPGVVREAHYPRV